MSLKWRNRTRHHGERINQEVYEKSNRETIKIVKIIKGSSNICGRYKSQKLTNQMTTGSNIREGGKWKHGCCSPLTT